MSSRSKRGASLVEDGDVDSGWEKFGSLTKKRKSRWATENDSDKTILNGLPTTVPAGLTKEQEDQYLLQLQIEEVTRRLRTGELGIPPNAEDRSPSPEPIYNNEGKRLNTREYRTRKKLEEERHVLIQQVIKANVDYKPPADYRPPLTRVSDRVLIPQDEHPEINFVGLLIGPRGNTLRNLEKETGTGIIIRGKGSVKEGKVGHKDGRPLPAQDEPLHAYVTANNPENVKKAVERIKQIIKEGIMVPDAENELRKQQLRELALLNGTLRENDALSKLKQFQEAQTIVTNTILCTICGGAGHISQDCKQRRPGDTFRAAMNQMPADRAKMDSEYMSLMAELGEGVPPSKQSSSGAATSTPNIPFNARGPLHLPPAKPLALPSSQTSWTPSASSQMQNQTHSEARQSASSNFASCRPLLPPGPPAAVQPLLGMPRQSMASSSSWPAFSQSGPSTSVTGMPGMMPPPLPPLISNKQLPTMQSTGYPWQQQQQSSGGGNMSASVSGSSAPRQLMDRSANRPSFPWNQQMPAPPIPPICPPWMQQQQSQQQQTSVTSQMEAPNGRFNFSFGSLAPPPPPPPPPMS